jgi:DNA-directed RNA polymerase sigma subunit (sigma70/sigma32)
MLTKKQEKELIKKALSGEKDAFMKLASDGVRLCVAVSKKYQDEKDWGVLVDAGFRGWQLAFDNYVANKRWDGNFRFSTYSTWWIRAAIVEEITGMSIGEQARKGV